MGEGLRRVAKQCGGITVKAKGETTRFDADGKIIEHTKEEYQQVCRETGKHEEYLRSDGSTFCRQCGAELRSIRLPRLSSRSTPPPVIKRV